MNCTRFQQSLFEYLDGSLSPSDREAALLHLHECADCRAAVRSHHQFAETISAQLRERVATVALDATAQRRIAAALRSNIAPRPIPFWIRYVMPAVAASVAMIAFISASPSILSPLFGLRAPSTLQIARTASHPAPLTLYINVSYSLHNYTFERNGDGVVDSLTSDTGVTEESLLAKN
jgi:anti-sigma factor RsiW